VNAVVFRGPGQIACEQVAYPELPPNGVILKVTACGICGGDLRAYRHGLRADRDCQILGHEISGVVHEIGRDVLDYQVGERLAVAADVACHQCYYCQHAYYNLCDDWKLIGLDYPGGMTEYMLLPEAILRRGIIHRIPASLSDRRSALAEPSSSVIWAQKGLDVQPGEVVAIFGDGPIGALHVQVARLRGAKPIMIGITGPRLDLFTQKDLGAWRVLDNLKDDVIAEVKALTGGRGADVAIVANPVKQTQAQAVQIVRKRGRIGLFGGLPKDDPMTSLDSNRIHYHELTVMGNFSYHPQMHADALDLLDRGLIDADKIITATYPLEQVRDAFEAALTGNELKVVLAPHGNLD
jgi:L-iditol 2-dehydrogenase